MDHHHLSLSNVNLLMSCTSLSFLFSKDHLTPHLFTFHNALFSRYSERNSFQGDISAVTAYQALEGPRQHLGSGADRCNGANINSRNNKLG